MGKKKNKNKPTIDIDVEVDTEGGPPADPDIPDLPTPKINVHVSNANNNTNANANANGNLIGNEGNKSLHLHHDHNHHHSHYARSVDRNSTGGEKVTERKEVVDVDDKGEGITTKTVKETISTPAAATRDSSKVQSSKAGSTLHHPSSPVGSVKSLSQSKNRPPDVVVNIALTQPVQPAPAPAPAPAVAITPPTPIPAPTARPPSIAPAAIPLPPSVPPSPTISVRSLAPSHRMATTKARTVFAVPIKEDDEDIEETTVVTTTRKIRKTPTPPQAAPLPLPLPTTYAPPGTPLVVADPTWKPLPEPRALPPSRPISMAHGHDNGGFVETITTTTTTQPVKEKSSFLDKLVPKFLKPTNTGSPPPAENHVQVRIHPGGDVDVDVGTGANTAGGATTIGGDGARTAALGAVPLEPQGRKAGIRPIPIIDYKALITQSPPRRQPSLPTSQRVPAAPKTILTMSADLAPDSNGNPHYHARVRDHTGVHKVDKQPAGTVKTSREKAHVHTHGNGDIDIHADGVDLHVGKKGDIDIEVDEVETKRERKERERRERQERREPLYRSLKGAYPAPLSERYAMPPPMEDIQNAARERYERRAGFPPQMGYGQPPMAMGGVGRLGGMGGMGMGPMSMGMGGMGMGMPGPPYPPPGPITMPRPPHLMGQRIPMYAGNFNPYPVSGMGMPMNNSVMGMGMGQMGYGQGMPGWQGQGYGWQGNPRFPGRSGM